MLSESSVERLNQLCGGAFDLFHMPQWVSKNHGCTGSCGHQLQNRGVRQAICRDVSQRPQGSTDQCSSTDQQFQGAFDGFYWPMDFESTRNMIAFLFASRSISDFFVGVIAGSRLYCKSLQSMEYAAIRDFRLYTSGTSKRPFEDVVSMVSSVETACLVFQGACHSLLKFVRSARCTPLHSKPGVATCSGPR